MADQPADPLFDPVSPTYQANPYATYERLRREAPVHRSALGFTIVSRYHDVMSVLRDSRASRETWRYSVAYRAARQAMSERFAAWVRSQLQFLDPPDHTRQRTLLARAFTPRAIDRLRPRIREIVRLYLAEVDGGDEFDLVTALARPLPNRVIIEMLGLPGDEPELAGDWTTKLVRGLSTIITDDDLIAADAALRGAQAVIERSIAEHRREPRDDLLTMMIEAEEAGDRLTTDELVGNVVMLFIAGSETTTNLIGNGLASLLKNPSQLEALRAEPALMVPAVEELLRFESPAQFQSRVAREPIELQGVTIEPGEFIFLALGSANRDPERWERADELDIRRPDLQHAAFGFGIHHCLGASLARCEAQESLAELLTYRTIELRTDELTWGGAAALSQRGLQRLPIAVRR
jgi:cytochrome P450